MGQDARDKSENRTFARRIQALVLIAGFVAIVLFKSLNSIDQIVAPSGISKNVVVKKDYDEGRCLNLDLNNEMDLLLEKFDQVYVVMPAKAAGSTYQDFSWACQKANDPTAEAWVGFNNILNDDESLMDVFKKELRVPTVIASHLEGDDVFAWLAKHATRNSLILYSHREDTNRLLSAIKEVLDRKCYKFNARDPGFTKPREEECHVTESALVEMIEQVPVEIGISGANILTCETYDSIRENAPNVVFVNYQQTTKMIQLLAKHHCPNFKEDLRARVGSDKKPVFVVLDGKETNGTVVSIDDWLNAKEHILEFVTKLKSEVSCQGTTRKVQDELMACPDETLQISGRSYDNQRVRFPFDTKKQKVLMPQS